MAVVGSIVGSMHNIAYRHGNRLDLNLIGPIRSYAKEPLVVAIGKVWHSATAGSWRRLLLLSRVRSEGIIIAFKISVQFDIKWQSSM